MNTLLHINNGLSTKPSIKCCFHVFRTEKPTLRKQATFYPPLSLLIVLRERGVLRGFYLITVHYHLKPTTNVCSMCLFILERTHRTGVNHIEVEHAF